MLSKVSITLILALNNSRRDDWIKKCPNPRVYSVEVTNPAQSFSLNFWALFIYFLIRPLHITQK